MTEGIRAVWSNPQQAGANLNGQVVPWCKEKMAQGKCIRARFDVEEDDRSVRQNAFYWGWVLKCIGEQARVNGIGADADGWHYWAKKEFLGYRFTKVKVPGSKRPVIRRELRSTKDLKVKAFSEFLEKLMAHAVTTFGVDFDGKRWEDWQA